MGLEHGFPGSFNDIFRFDIRRGGLSFEKKTKTIIVRVPAGKSPEGKQYWRTEKREVPKDVSKSPPPNFTPGEGPHQLPLPSEKKKDN